MRISIHIVRDGQSKINKLTKRLTEAKEKETKMAHLIAKYGISCKSCQAKCIYAGNDKICYCLGYERSLI
jgi:predicted 3-demethylubiquinone-9 3-methyltransferase (glyoxalase superfamily)